MKVLNEKVKQVSAGYMHSLVLTFGGQVIQLSG
jgi:hypothetical protein